MIRLQYRIWEQQNETEKTLQKMVTEKEVFI